MMPHTPEDTPTSPDLPDPKARPIEPAVRAPTQIGPYRILEPLGEGGMGTVYLAEQTEPVRRRVALKVIKPGMDTTAVIARFESERQALALMDHANIAQVYDAGATPEGRPYFVMELVRGLPITAHADRHRMSIDERIELFMQVCAAVQHAHQKGIIHRDLKPSNILVTYNDNQPYVKVIDFGVAKAINQSAVEGEMFTRLGQLIGTPEYMSPEQAESSAQGVDTRTDVYALGVILYELLAGALPFDDQTLRSAALTEIHRVIREVYPQKPSTRLSAVTENSAEVASSISKARRSDPRSLSRRLRGDLDWIVMKCLEKDRRRRYESASALADDLRRCSAAASALADDLRRYLHSEPVTASPPSLMYQARKFVGRHRVGVSAAGLILAALVVGLVSTTWQWQRAEEARAAAEASDVRSRGIANALISQFHDEVVPLPGSSRVRESFVREGLSLLESMHHGNDPVLMLDIADGYDRVSAVQAGLRTASRGDLDAAERGFATARDLREQAAASPRAPRTRVTLGLAASNLYAGDMLRERERLDESIAAYRKGLDRLDTLAPAETRTDEAVRMRALLQVALANALGRTDPSNEERIRLLTASIDALRPVVASEPSRANRGALARAETNLGEYLLETGAESDRSLGTLTEAAALWRQILEGYPSDSISRHDLAGAEYWRASVLASADRLEDAIAAWDEAERHYGFLAEADPTDRRAALGVARVLEAKGNALRRSDPQRAVDELARAVSIIDPWVDRAPHDPVPLRVAASCRYLRARTVMAMPEPDAALGARIAAEAFASFDTLDRLASGAQVWTRSGLANSAQVWVVAITRAPGGLPADVHMPAAREAIRIVIARWEAGGDSESPSLAQLRSILASVAE